MFRREDRQIKLLGQNIQKLSFGQGAKAHQIQPQQAAVLGLKRQSVGDIGGTHQAARDQQFAQTRAIRPGRRRRGGTIRFQRRGVHCHLSAVTTEPNAVHRSGHTDDDGWAGLSRLPLIPHRAKEKGGRKALPSPVQT